MSALRAFATLVLCLFVLTAPALADGLDDVTIAAAALDAAEYHKAVEYFSRAVDSGAIPSDKLFLVLVSRGNAHFGENDLEKAQEDYDRAISLNPGYAEAYYNRGNLHCLLRHFDLALADYDKAISLTGNDANAHNNRAAVWQEKGNYQSALANYNRAIAINPNEPLFYANRGRLFDSVGDDALARADYLQAKELDPSIKTPID